MVREIPLSRGLVALVDDEDYERVMQRKWHADPVDYRHLDHGRFYAKSMSPENCDRKIFLHRFILGISDRRRVDHKNGDGLDCQKANLRVATKAQNSANVPKRSTSRQPYKGIEQRYRSAKWVARIRVNGRRIRSRSCATPEQAARLYDAMAREYFGEFAWLNFPDDEECAA